MKITKKHKDYIRKNLDKSDVKTLSKKTGLPEKKVRKYIAHLKERTKAKVKKVFEREEEFDSFASVKRFLRKNTKSILLLVFITVLIYANALGGELVSDDLRSIENHAAATDLKLAFESAHMSNIVSAIFYKYFALNPVPRHIYSVTMHSLNVVLVYLFISMLFNRKTAFFAALLFATHPVNTEAVAWFSGRPYLERAMVTLLTFITYLLYKNSKNYAFLVWSVVIFGFGLFILKTPWLLVVVPILVIVEQLIINKKINFKEFFAYTPHTVFTLAFVVFFLTGAFATRTQTLNAEGATGAVNSVPLETRTPFTTYMSFKLLMYPSDLTIYHEGDVISQNLFLIMQIFTVVLVLLILVLLAQKSVYGALLAVIIISIAPTFSPVQVAWFVAERYLYLGTIFYAIFLTLLAFKIENEMKIKNFAVVTLLVLVGIFSIRTVIRNEDWRTRLSLWESTARVAPNSPRVYNNLGDVYGGYGDFERAIQMFNTAIALDPNYAEAMHNLGNTYLQVGDLENAKLHLGRSLETKPSLYQSAHKLGAIAYTEGDLETAKEYFERALEFNPEYTPAINGLQTIKNSN